MTRPWISPLRLRGADLPPQLLLVGRFLAFALVLLGERPFRRHLPYFEFLDALGSTAHLDMALKAAACAGVGLLLVTRFARLGSFLIGCAFLVGLLACRPCQSVAHTYVACVFLILAASSSASGSRLLRAQVLLLYAGATLSKATDGDWWNGRYFETLMVDRHHHELFIRTAALLPPLSLSVTMGVATIAVQAGLVVCFLVRRLHAVGIVVGIVFHGTMVLLMNETFGPFLVATLISYVAFLAWPERVQVRPGSGPAGRWIARAARWGDFDGVVETEPSTGVPEPGARFEVIVAGEVRRGILGGLTLLCASPAAYAAAALLLTCSGGLAPVRNLTIAALVAAALIVAPSALRRVLPRAATEAN